MKYADIPELVELQSGRSLIRVPGEQNVPFTPRVRALVDTAEFQRLSQISQLGLVSKVYPGARHTRFEHALGVYHNTLKYVYQLMRDHHFHETVDPKSVELLIVASLLHDLGHWPFCHPIEDLGLDDITPHESHAYRFLSDQTELGQTLRAEWYLEPLEVLDVLVPRSDSRKLRLLRSILSGPIDVDKMDYLDRDSLHCGVPYGRNFDRQRLIQSLIVNESGDGLAITAKGKTAAELMVFARYVMFSEVYWHHAVRSATSMFARGFYELRPEFDVGEMFACTDAQMISKLRDIAIGTPAAELLDGIFGIKRALYKQSAEYSRDQMPDIYDRIAGRPFNEIVALSNQLVAAVNSERRLDLNPMQLLIDAPPPHREIEFEIDVFFPKRDIFRPLREVSPVVDTLAARQFDDWVKRVRVFTAPQFTQEVQGLDWDGLLRRHLPE